ncbi:MAG: AI-2E family transporter [Clostridia bacterium]|nr:AI-2E family transporter [Clostridia bacterium]
MFKDKDKSPMMRRAMILIAFAALAFSVALKPERLGSAFTYVWGVFKCITAGLCLAFVLNLIMNPIETRLTRLFKKRPRPKLVRAVSLLITFVIALGFVALMISSILPSIRNIVETIAQLLPGSLEDLPQKLEDALRSLGLSEKRVMDVNQALRRTAESVVAYIDSSLSAIPGFAFDITTGVFGGIIDVILVIALSIYVLAGKEKLSAFFTDLINAYLPARPRDFIIEIRELVYDKFSDFFKGQVTEALILGILCYLGMLIFRFPNRGSISVLVGASALVPVIGPWVGSITSILLSLIVSPLNGLLFAIFILVLQQIEDNVIYPRVVGHSMSVPGILVLAAVIIGAEVYGMIGIVVAVPLSAVGFELVKKHMSARLRKRRDESKEA